MIVTVNGKTWGLNIGCRTFISATELFEYFGVTPSKSLKFVLNGKLIGANDYIRTPVSNNSTLLLEGVSLAPDGKRSAMISNRFDT